MPTENERKFVVRIKSEKDIEAVASGGYYIRQGYLDSTNARIRSKLPIPGAVNFMKGSGAVYEFCYKHLVNNARLVEIETKIDKRDFEDLWEWTARRLVKTRYHVGPPSALWEVDFFEEKGKVYFAMAEFEMPEGQTEPDSIPAVIQENLVLAVPPRDGRFTSKLLSNSEYAKNLLADLKK